MHVHTLGIGIIYASVAAHARGHERNSSRFDLRPFEIDLSRDVTRMQDLINGAYLPSEEEYPELGASAGIDLAVLKSLKQEWLADFDWNKEQEEMNSFHHYKAAIEGLGTHFIHEKSSEDSAIPLILGHGWPGSFLEFAPVVKSLTQPARTSSGRSVSFDIVVPSLPGFVFSERPPADWTIDDTGRVWNTLMTEVLGYEQYAVFGTDYGAGPTYSMYDRYNQSVRAAHFVFLPFYPQGPEQLAAQNVSLSPTERFEMQRLLDWEANGSAYLQEQNTKPNTIGLALYDSPIGQLSWIAEKYIAWSDPRQGTSPSVLTHKEILRSVSLYYLSRSFVSSCYIYFQNRMNGFKMTYNKARTDAPMLFSAFKYNVGFWPPAVVAQVGNLVSYRNHDFGGHFPGLDNPPQLLEDLREIGEYWNAQKGTVVT